MSYDGSQRQSGLAASNQCSPGDFPAPAHIRSWVWGTKHRPPGTCVLHPILQSLFPSARSLALNLPLIQEVADNRSYLLLSRRHATYSRASTRTPRLLFWMVTPPHSTTPINHRMAPPHQQCDICRAYSHPHLSLNFKANNSLFFFGGGGHKGADTVAKCLLY